jgi:hypothetical protein
MSSWWRAISCSSVSISVSSIGCLRHRPSMRDMRARNEISIDALSALLTAKRVAPATHERQGYRRLSYMRFETVPTAVPSRTLRNPAFAGWRSLCFCSIQSNRWNVLLRAGSRPSCMRRRKNGGEKPWHHRHDGLGRRVDMPLVAKPEFGRVSHRTSL